MSRAFKAAALAVLLLAANAPAAGADEKVSQTAESHTLDHKTTAKKRYELRVPGAGSRVSLRVKASVREGELRLVVRDAAGRVRQEARLAPSKSRPSTYEVESDEARSAAGVWTVEVETRDALGSYGFTFTLTDR